MVSWGFSFKKGFIIFLWGIVWCIIGGVISGAIGGMAFIGAWGTVVEAATFEEATSAILGAMAVMVAGILIGTIISMIGIFATIFKITLESAVEKAKK